MEAEHGRRLAIVVVADHIGFTYVIAVDRAHLLLQHWLSSNSLGRDGRLPPERTLATEFGVTRAELRKALALLEAEGRLARHVGRGTFLVGASRVASATPPSGGAPDPPAAPLADVTSPRQALEACLAIEPVLARLAAMNAPAAAMRAVAGAAETAAGAETWEAYDAADAAFHRAIAEAVGNPVLLTLHDAAAAVRSGIAWGVRRNRESPPSPLHPSVAEHRAVAAAITARDQHAAFDAARHHFLVEAAALLDPFA